MKTQEERQKALEERNAYLHDMETQLRSRVQNMIADLHKLNSQLTGNLAEQLTSEQVYILLEDRLKEVAFPHMQVHRF